MNLKITNWFFALVGALVMALGFCWTGIQLVYVTESFNDIVVVVVLSLLFEIGGGIIVGSGIGKHSQKNSEEGKRK